jgi:hypothetical protein
MKMSQSKKRPNERVTLTCAHKRKENIKLSLEGMMTKEQG